MCSSISAAVAKFTMSSAARAIVVCALLAVVQTGRHDCDNGCAPMWEYPAPSIDSVDRMAGEMAYLKCRAFGNPRPRVTWLRDGKVLENTNGKFEIHRWSLTLNNLQPQDTGIYTCVATNEISYIRWNYYVSVHDGMFDYEGWPSNVTTYEGRTAMFECYVTYSEGLRSSVTWLHVRQNDTASVDDRGGHVVLEHSIHKGPNTLTLGNVSLDDSGQYTCVIQSDRQISRRTAWLEVLPKNGIDEEFVPRIQSVKDRNTIGHTPGQSSFRQGVATAVGIVFGLVGLGMAVVCISTIYRSFGRHACAGYAPSREDEEQVTAA